PRDWDNIGYFITCERNYMSPDGNYKGMQDIVKKEQYNATNRDEHINLVKNEINRITDEEVLYIFPITRCEHGHVTYFVGDSGGFDYSLCGMYIITRKSLENTGVAAKNEERILEIINNELENYNKWVNGSIYQFTLYDERGEEVDSLGDLYSFEEIMEYLPKEFENEYLEYYLKY